VSFDALGPRFGGFRFDGAAEPEGGFTFIAPAQITETDWLVDLRPEGEPGPSLPGATRHGVPDFDTLHPHGPRAVLACRSGLRSWQAAARLRAHWDGEIALIALGTDQQETNP